MGGTGGIGALASDSIYPLSRMDKTQYATPLQLPTSAEVISSDYDPKTDAFTGMPQNRFAKGGDVEGDVDVSFGYPNSQYMDLAYGFAHDPVYNAMMKSRSEGVLEKYQSGKKGELSPEEEEALKIRAMVMSGNPKYDPRYMPLRLDDRPISPIQAAMLRLQAEKQIGEGSARAGISALAAALPNRHGVTTMPGAYDVGYNAPVGPGNLDVSAFRAMRGMPDGKVPYGVNARYSIPFAEGGITSTPRFDGETGSKVEDPNATPDPALNNPDFANLSLDPERAQELYALKTTDPKQYNAQLINVLGDQLIGSYRTNQNYDAVAQQFNSLKEQDPNAWYKKQLEFLGGQHGWQIGQNRSDRLEAIQPQIDSTIEQAKKAGLGENEINKILGSSSQSANIENQKRIINQQQDGGGYMGLNAQDYITIASILGSGAAAAYFAPAAAAAGSTAGSVAPLTTTELLAGAGGSFVPTAGTGASFVLPETLAASSGALGGGTAAAAPGYGINFGATGASSGINAGALGGSAGITAPSTASLASGAGLGITEGSALAGTGAAAAKTAGMTTGQKVLAASLAAKALGGSSGGGGSSAPAMTTSTTQAPPTQNIASNAYNPAFTMPNMFAMNQAAPGAYYQPQTFNYNTRYAAQGGLMYQQGGVADLGGYAAGGKLLKGPGDGMSDSIVANIAGKQPARLADGEFVVPADVVSHLGNGSTDAGAKHLYKMMDRIRQARTGNSKQGKRINPDKFLPKG
jgi:hypothetical protein